MTSLRSTDKAPYVALSSSGKLGTDKTVTQDSVIEVPLQTNTNSSSHEINVLPDLAQLPSVEGRQSESARLQPSSTLCETARDNVPNVSQSGSNKEPAQEMSTPTEEGETRSDSALGEAINEFKQNYNIFAEKHTEYTVLVLDSALDEAFQLPNSGFNIKATAEIFRKHIGKTLETMQTKKAKRADKWITKVGQFVTKLYSVAKLASGLTAAIAEVCFSE